MQPTMKLRFRPATPGDKCIHFGEQWRSAGGWVCLDGLVLQQWHEGVAHTAENGEVTEHVYGEWRDVPIEVES